LGKEARKLEGLRLRVEKSYGVRGFRKLEEKGGRRIRGRGSF
jgi:hypothetical protein